MIYNIILLIIYIYIYIILYIYLVSTCVCDNMKYPKTRHLTKFFNVVIICVKSNFNDLSEGIMLLEKQNHLIVKGCSEEQITTLKEHLTFDNPSYLQAKRFSRSRYISIPKYLTYFTEKTLTTEKGKEKVLEVPIGVDIEKILGEKAEKIDKRAVPKAIFPKFSLDLRDTQKLAEEQYLKEQKKEFPRNIVQLNTGKGKSILALKLAEDLGLRTLVLVHKDDLVVGWQKDIQLCYPNMKTGLIKAKKREIGEQITIATVQTLSRMSEEELSKYTDQFGFVIQDECLVGETLVVLNDGGVKYISDIHNNECLTTGYTSHVFSRESDIWRLECSHALIEGSPSHPTWYVKKKSDAHQKYTFDDVDCKPISELTRSDLVLIQRKIPHIEKNTLSPIMARFIAMIQCDGHLDKVGNRVKVNFSKDSEFYLKVFSDVSKELGIEFKSSIDCRGNPTYWFSDKSLKEYLEKECLIPRGKKSGIIQVPSFMYYAPLESVKAYIETCFSCEGDLNVVKTSSRINFSTCSKVFAQGIALLLKKFGIVCNIQLVPKKGNHNVVYRVSAGGIFFNMFMDTFTLIARKMTLNRNKAESYKNRFVGDYYLSDVKRCEPCGYKDVVYDFTVDKTHSFVANGVYTHNCHHVGLNIFNIIDKFNSKYKLGLSATPKRSDGLDFVFDIFFGGIGFKHEVEEGDADISSVEVETLVSNFKYKPFLYEGQVFNYYDFNPEDLPKNLTFLESLDYDSRPRIPYLILDNEAVLSRATKTLVCSKIVEEYKKGHSIIALFTQKEHIVKYFNYLVNFIPKEQIILYYGDSKEKSEVLMKKAEDREALVTLATYAKATEGTNVKAWEVEFLVSSINNSKNVEQATGRIRRRKEGKLDPVKVYDVRYLDSYSISRHYNTRVNTYKKLNYKIKGLKEKQSIFSRGYLTQK